MLLPANFAGQSRYKGKSATDVLHHPVMPHFMKHILLMLLPCLLGCFNTQRLKLLWQAPIASETTPLVVDGTVYIKGFRAGHPEEPTRLFALDAVTGQELWVSADSIETLYGASAGFMFFRNMASHLVQLNAKTGEKIFESDENNLQILQWVIQGDVMYLVNVQMEVVAVDNRQNKVLWRKKLPLDTGNDLTLAYNGPLLIVGGNHRDKDHQYGAIWALDAATGQERWHFEAPPPREYAPLKVMVSASFVLATNTSPLNLHTHVLEVQTGKEVYPPLAAFDFYECYGDTAYAPAGTYDLKTGARIGDKASWLTYAVRHNGTAWQRQLGQIGTAKAFFLRTTYDGDVRGNRNWLNTPPNSYLEGFDVSTGKSRYKTPLCPFTQFSLPVAAEGRLYHTSIAIMKEGKSGVWAYRMP